MSNLVDPRDSTPATAAQRRMLTDAYRALGGATKTRRRTPARALSIDSLTANGIETDVLTWLLFQGHVHHFQEITGRHGIGMSPVESAVVGLTSSFTLTDAGRAFGALLLARKRAGDRIALPMGVSLAEIPAVLAA
jgi:hypothetical protein